MLWSLLLSLAFGAPAHAANCNVRDYGAKGDRAGNDQRAIQAAIDACGRSGGGEVLIPPGNYPAGKLVLKSGVTLRLSTGATLWVTGRMSDYNRPTPGPRQGEPCLIEADGQDDIGVIGDGTIVGTGQAELARRTGDYRHLPAHRFGIIHFVHCRNVRLRDITILFSARHTVKFNECENVSVIGLSILNNYLRTETDGIDPISTRNVFISNCHIVAGDDCICPKTDGGVPLDNLVVDNCILESCSTAIKLGTGSTAVFRDIQVSNCVIRNTTIGIGLYIKDGGGVERASFSNISIGTTRPDEPIAEGLRASTTPIFIDLTKRKASTPLAFVRDVSFSNIQIESDHGILIQGMAQDPIENLTLRNISLRATRACDFSRRTRATGGGGNYENSTTFVRKPAYVTLAHIDGLTVDGLRVLVAPDVFKLYGYSALGLFDSDDAVISNVQRRPAGTAEGHPVMMFDDCRQVLVTGCLALPGTPAFLGLSGENTRGIRLAGNDLSNVATPVVRGSDVPADALKD